MGRKRIPEQWSRVICLSTDDLASLRVFELAPDLLLANAMKCTATRGKKQAQWRPIYWPDAYVKEGHDMTVSGNKLSESRLKKLGKRVSQLRKIQRDRAEAVLDASN